MIMQVVTTTTILLQRIVVESCRDVRVVVYIVEIVLDAEINERCGMKVLKSQQCRKIDFGKPLSELASF